MTLEGFTPIPATVKEQGTRGRLYVSFNLIGGLNSHQSWRGVISQAAVDALAFDRYALLLHNPEAREVALVPQAEPGEHHAKLSKLNARGRAFTATTICRMIGATDERRKFPARIEDGALIFSYA